MTRPSRRRRRPTKQTIGPAPTGTVLAAVAAAATYVGSPEHKDTPSFAGPSRPRPDATICDPTFLDRQEEIEGWLQSSIRAGMTSTFWETGFPRYVWHRENTVVYIARHTGNGTYKGWQLSKDEWPEGI